MDYNRFFPMLTRPDLKHRFPSADGTRRLQTYLLQLCGILAPVQPGLAEEMLTVFRVVEWMVALSPQAFVDEIGNQNSKISATIQRLSDLNEALPETIVLVDAERHFYAEMELCVMRVLMAFYRRPERYRRAIASYAFLASQCMEAQYNALVSGITYILDADDRLKREHAQTLEFALEFYINAYLGLLCTTILRRYFIAMQTRNPHRPPELPTMREVQEYIAAFGALPLQPDTDKGDAMLCEALDFGHVVMIMACAFQTQWGDYPQETFLNIAALACMLGCDACAAEALAICRALRGDASTKIDNALVAELASIYP